MCSDIFLPKISSTYYMTNRKINYYTLCHKRMQPERTLNLSIFVKPTPQNNQLVFFMSKYIGLYSQILNYTGNDMAMSIWRRDSKAPSFICRSKLHYFVARSSRI